MTQPHHFWLNMITCIALPVIYLLAALPATAAPIVAGNFSAPRFPTGYTPCSAPYGGSSQPSSVDCMVEGGANSLLPNDNLYAIVEGRAGNRAIGGDYELSIQNNTGSTSSSGFQGHLAWANGQVYNFIVAFNPATQLLTFDFNNGGVVLSRTLAYTPDRPVTDLFIRTTSATLNGSVTVNVNSITQNGLTTTFTNAQSSATFTNTSEVEYLWITELNPTQAWTMAGNASMSWVAAINSSSVAFQIKVGEANVAVPEPSTFGLAFGALCVVALARARERNLRTKPN